MAGDWKGPPEKLQTQSVRMNLRPGSLPDFWCAIPPAAGSWTSARHGFLHDGIAEVIDHRRDGETPPSRSYRLFSGAAGFDWAFALSARANIVNGAAVSASPATTFRLR